MSSPSSQIAHLASLVRSAIPRIHPGGRIIIGGIWVGSQVVSTVLHLLGLRRLSRFTRRVGLSATVGSALFFRMPERVPPAGNALVVAPADGVVSLITEAAPPAETGMGDTPRTRISIFLSVLDVHVQYAPVTGAVAAVHYHRGQFLSADLDKASEVNERNSLVLRPAAGGDDLVVTQIAGLIARRIVCDVAEGDELTAGRVYGLIRFGSRLDVYLPAGAVPQVRIGQRAVGGETVLAALPAAASEPAAEPAAAEPEPAKPARRTRAAAKAPAAAEPEPANPARRARAKAAATEVTPADDAPAAKPRRTRAPKKDSAAS